MVNGPLRHGTLVAVFGLALVLATNAGANGTFPFERQLTADAPLPGCRQPPSMSASAQTRRVHFRVCCNQIGAPGTIDGDRLVITGPAIATRMHCGEGQAAEDRFLKEIDSKREIRWRYEGELIVLETEPPLRFRVPPS